MSDSNIHLSAGECWVCAVPSYAAALRAFGVRANDNSPTMLCERCIAKMVSFRLAPLTESPPPSWTYGDWLATEDGRNVYLVVNRDSEGRVYANLIQDGCVYPCEVSAYKLRPALEHEVREARGQ